jgi:phosphomannomutase / phosphoglucomutase
MKRLMSILAMVCVLFVLIAGSGVFLMFKVFIAQSKVDAVAAVANGVSLTLSEEVKLLNSMLDKIVQDPEIINAAAINNPDQLALSIVHLEQHFPGVLMVKFLLPDNADPNKSVNVNMGYADLDMAKKTFAKDQQTAIQGDANSDRHLAIARRIMQNGNPVGVILVGLNYDFVNRILAATTLEKGYIELRQDKLVLATAGKKSDKADFDNDPIKVPNTDWQLYYENSGGTSVGEFSLMVGIVLVPALVVALGFVTGYRKLSGLLTEDVSWVMKAFKDIITEKPIGDYPIKLDEMQVAISTLAQFKRVANDKWFQI